TRTPPKSSPRCARRSARPRTLTGSVPWRKPMRRLQTGLARRPHHCRTLPFYSAESVTCGGPDQCNAFVAAIMAALRLGSSPLSWNQAGLIVTAMLLQPISAGEPTRQLVQGYEELVRERSDFPKLEKGWSGDVWAFANWARQNLPGFDPYQSRVG